MKQRARRARRARKGPSPVAQVLDVFLSARLSKRTIQAYRADLDQFTSFYGISREEAVQRLASPEANHLAQRWLDSLVGVESYATRRRRASTLRSLRRLCGTFGLCEGQLHVEVLKKAAKDMRGPSVDVVRKILTACGEGAEGLRNRALIILMATLGLRRSEAASLRVDDYDREDKRLRVYGKRGKMRVMDVPGAAAEVLEEWIDFDKPEEAIFHAIGRSTPLTGSGVSDLFNRLSERVGEKVRPGGMRHFALTKALEAGFSWKTVMGFAGHEKAESLTYYDDRPEPGPDAATRVAESVADKLTKGIEDG